MATKLADLTVAATTGAWSTSALDMTAGSKTVTLRRKADGAVLATRSFTVEAAGGTITLVGTPVAGTGTGSSITLPSGRQAGDIIVVSVSSGTSEITNYTRKVSDSFLGVYWRRATNNASDAFSAPVGTEYACAIYRGCVASGDPFEAASASVATGETSGGPLSIPQITSATNGAWILAAASGSDSGWDDGEGGAGAFSGPTWAAASGAAPTLDASRGNISAGIGLWHSEKATAGATGACSVRFYMSGGYNAYLLGTSTWGVLLALKPA